MTKYHGICVGGPLAGKWMTQLAPLFNVPEVQAQYGDCKQVDFDKLCAITEVTTVTYQFHILPFPEGALGFWIPQGGGPFWALREIIESYSMYEDLKT